MVKGFRHTCIVVKDLEKSLNFYRDILGLKLERVIKLEGDYPEKVLGIKGIKLVYAKMRSKNQPKNSSPVFELHFWEKPEIEIKPGYNHISLTVKNLNYEYKRLKKLGVRFISPPTKSPYTNTRVCFCYDPDDYLIELVEDL
ncbi:MAG: VOC family protein [Candidatus Omnitrophica bacterium]|nr:VOC family protein [Candidatus Omnitrophota bacterium]MCM8798187.1 VOC family protein [Candidatus Omnitrophota bacterium]